MLRIEPVHDDGQRLPGLHGHVIGLIDSAEELSDAVDKLIESGFSDDAMICLAGADGIALIERVERHYFGDSENEIGTTCISALRDGKLVFAVQVKDGDEAQRAATAAGAAGGHHFVHFGLFVNTQFN